MIKKNKIKYPLTFEVRKDIDSLVIGMPNIPKANRIGGLKKNSLTGIELINHRVELIKAYNENGKEGISRYLNFIEDCKKKIAENKKESLNLV